jgi:hypothetical protein
MNVMMIKWIRVKEVVLLKARSCKMMIWEILLRVREEYKFTVKMMTRMRMSQRSMRMAK